VLNRARDAVLPRFDPWSVATAAAPLALCALMTMTMLRHPLASSPDAVRGEPDAIAARMFSMDAHSGWWLLFVAVGVTLLVAVVGAVLIAKRHLDTPPESDGAAPAAESGHGH
jgi:NADH:ubiquinone oxidoreductase subunit 6 (subunit J)